MVGMEKTQLAIILLAGIGSRMKNLTEVTHKSLLQVGTKPVIWYALSSLRKIGVKKLILVVGGRQDQIRRYINTEFPEFEKVYVENPSYQETNTLHSFSLAAPFIKGQSFFRQDGDLIYEPELLYRLMSSGQGINVAFLPKKAGEDLTEYRVSLEKNSHKILRFSKQLKSDESDGIGIGIEFISKKAAAGLAKELALLQGEEFYKLYAEDSYTSYKVKKSVPIAVDCADLLCCEVDTPEDLKIAESKCAAVLKKIQA